MKSVSFKIDTATFTVGGTDLITTDPYLMTNWISDKSGSSALKPTSVSAVAYDDSRCLCFDWGLDPQNRLSCSGAISFSQVNYPVITLTHQTLGANPEYYEIQVVHEYFNILSLDNMSGSVQITVQS